MHTCTLNLISLIASLPVGPKGCNWLCVRMCFCYIVHLLTHATDYEECELSCQHKHDAMFKVTQVA